MFPVTYKRNAEIRFLHELYSTLVLKGMVSSVRGLEEFQTLSFVEALSIIGTNIPPEEVYEMYNRIVLKRRIK